MAGIHVDMNCSQDDLNSNMAGDHVKMNCSQDGSNLVMSSVERLPDPVCK